jgi:hypothetical protein
LGRLVAYVVGDVDGVVVREAVGRVLPGHLVPSEWCFVDRLPLTPNGKVDRRALAGVAPVGAGGSVVAPRGPVEEVVAAVWCDVLGLGSVSVWDDFFDVGGHSLVATRVVSRLREVFGVALSVRAAFEHRTVAALAHHLTTDPIHASADVEASAAALVSEAIE